MMSLRKGRTDLSAESKTRTPEKKRYKKARMVRINVFFFIIFLLFVSLIIRLGVVQIVKGEEYSKEVNRTEVDIAKYPAPRGKMYDRYNRIVVDNENVPAITYTVERTTKAEEKLETAKKLAKLIDIDTQFLKERDLRDYWIAKNPEQAKKLLTDEEKKLKPKETYRLQVKRVPKEEIEKIQNNPEELELAAFYTKFSSGYAYEPQIVTTNLTSEEVSLVAEHLEYLPGVDVITDWNRVYPYEDTFRSILGRITDAKEGIPQDRESYFTARGYARNERVGVSYLEQQYEDYLNPRKAQLKYISNKDGETIAQQLIDNGRRGYDLKLSIDIELQKKVEQIIESRLKEAKGHPDNYLLDRAFVVMMDPFNGDILAMAGKMYQNGEMLNFDYGAFATQYEMGSTVKGATVLAGYQFGIKHGTVFYDAPIKIKHTKEKSSYKNFGPINDINALKVSSNVYMFHIAMKIAGINYVYNGGFPATIEDFIKMRNYYAQFGLGVPTGIDLPFESTGQQSDPDTPGKLLDLAIGQFDTYTPLQMAQYVSTIANGGYRVQPRLVRSIHEPVGDDEIGPIAQERPTNILNRINNTDEDINRVQYGFKLVTGPGGTASGMFNHDVAGKTGTAETYYYGPKRQYWGKYVYNLTFVGYYPSDRPEVAFSVVVPWARTSRGEIVNKKIANDIVNAYVELQKQYQSGEVEAKEPSNDGE